LKARQHAPWISRGRPAIPLVMESAALEIGRLYTYRENRRAKS
jgi:hypothetical protein